MTKDVAKAKTTEVGTYDYGEDSHVGFEGVGVNDLSIPFLNVMQTNSREVEEQTIEGVKAGDIVNSVTKEILPQPLVFQPVFMEEAWMEWIPRLKGGGLVDRHEPSSDIVKDVIAKNGGSRIPPKGEDGKRVGLKYNGNELVETYYMYGLFLDEKGDSVEGMGVIAFASTKITVYRKWLTSMFMVKGKPPMFAHRAKITSVKQKNAAGQPFFNYGIMPFGSTWKEGLINPGTDEGRSLLEEGKSFAAMIQDGLARADMGGAESETGGGNSSGGGNSDAGDEAPF